MIIPEVILIFFSVLLVLSFISNLIAKKVITNQEKELKELKACRHDWKFLTTYKHSITYHSGETKKYDFRSYECTKCKKLKRENI